MFLSKGMSRSNVRRKIVKNKNVEMWWGGTKNPKEIRGHEKVDI